MQWSPTNVLKFLFGPNPCMSARIGFVAALLFVTQAWAQSDLKHPNAPLAYEEPTFLAGSIYEEGTLSPKLLFKFQRQASRSGAKLEVRREYTYPDGKLAATERVTYRGDELMDYELNEVQTGAKGRARIQAAPDHSPKKLIEFQYADHPGAKVKTRTEVLSPDTLINDMVGPFLVSHWDALIHGDKLRCRYIVVPRRETVGFTFLRVSDAKWRGRDVLLVRMEPSSALLAALVKPLFFTIEKSLPHRILQYVGRTTPQLQDRGKWNDLDAVTVFDWESAR